MNDKLPFQVEIPKRGPCCSHNREILTPGMEYYSLLKNGEENAYLRQDFCLACWEKLSQDKTFQQSRSIWKSMVPLKKEASALPKQRDERAFYLLKEALNKQDRESNTEAFVLALYLARKRLLFLRQEMKLNNGLLGSIYEVAETEEMLCVPKIALSELHVERVQLELANKFNPKT